MKLVVFADDWGGHPSSCQHLLRPLLARHGAVWVNTIGTRRPSLTVADLHRAAVRLRAWSRPRHGDTHRNPVVVTPAMWPGFRGGWQRRLNARLMAQAVAAALGSRQGERRVAITTIPITADLIGRIDVDQWVYYCVDDFSVWPGLDGAALRALDDDQLRRADHLVVASEVLAERAARFGRSATLLTHGVDMDAWRAPSRTKVPSWWGRLKRPIWLFWGLIDVRLDADWCRALADGAAGPGTLVLVGPHGRAAPDIAGSVAPGPVPFEQLPALAAAADVLVMPYADLPVTQAMQPLKLKEYLATDRPVVMRDLPATRTWCDAGDAVSSQTAFVEAVRMRSQTGASPDQLNARSRLHAEGWPAKARIFERLLWTEEVPGA
jgi:glycosyltransferase involved in cell wall biosynthesis